MKKHQTSSLIPISCVVALMLLLTGCGEFTYKRGATVQQLNEAKDDCQQTNGSETEIQKCLEDNGWIVVDMQKQDLMKPIKIKPITTTYHKSTNDPFVDENKVSPQQEDEASYSDPNELVHVSSWWKKGAGFEQLEQDGQSCMKDTGETDYNGNYSEVTVGFVYCMQQLKWRVLLDSTVEQ